MEKSIMLFLMLALEGAPMALDVHELKIHDSVTSVTQSRSTPLRMAE